MAISKIGMIIRRRRTELGLSQEDLADGICAVTTLSRIENGERMPTQNHLEMLLQRIGYSDMMLESYVDEDDFLAHDLKFKIRQAQFERNLSLSRELLMQFEQLALSSSNIDKQFLLLAKVLLYPEKYSNEERMALLEEAIRLTHPKYGQGKVPYLLSYEEIVLINNIATSYARCGRQKDAIDMLYHIVEYYDAHIINVEESLRTEPLTLYNLSKILGMENRFGECIDICDRGIALAKKTGRGQLYAQTLYNKAWAFVHRGRSEDFADAKELARKALNVAEAFDFTAFANHCRQFIEENKLQ